MGWNSDRWFEKHHYSQVTEDFKNGGSVFMENRLNTNKPDMNSMNTGSGALLHYRAGWLKINLHTQQEEKNDF